MPSASAGPAPKPLERVMIFIDGGYLRRLFLNLFNDDNIDCTKLARDLIKWYNTWPPNPHRANLIRIYYYDGIADSKYAAEAYAKHRDYFEALEKDNQNLDVNLGEAVKTPNGSFRQKGVDVLLTIDAIAMAYQIFMIVVFSFWEIEILFP